jgi:Histidinol-phosphate/aromatic aminotransferase and cobyric acid decarboxylase
MVVKKSGAQSVVVEADSYAHDLKAMANACDENTRALFLANPNNPTGTCFSQRELLELLDQVSDDTLVVLDEAYAEYAPALFEQVAEPGDSYPDSEQMLREYPNLIVTRSFSKAYGLGGLRVGYGISHPAIADVLNRARQPFNVSNVALAAAKAAVEDQEYINDSVQLNNSELARLKTALIDQGIECIQSCGNFITMDCASIGRDALELERALLERGVILRGLAVYAMPNHIRVSVGLPEENDRFLSALEYLLNV